MLHHEKDGSVARLHFRSMTVGTHKPLQGGDQFLAIYFSIKQTQMF